MQKKRYVNVTQCKMLHLIISNCVEEKHLLYQAVNMFISDAKLDILRCEPVEICSILELIVSIVTRQQNLPRRTQSGNLFRLCWRGLCRFEGCTQSLDMTTNFWQNLTNQDIPPITSHTIFTLTAIFSLQLALFYVLILQTVERITTS